MNPDKYNDEIDLIEVFKLLWKKKYLIGTITLIAAVLSIIFALNLPNIYKSNALLAPSATEDSLTAKLGNLSSFSSFAGINLQSEYSNSQEGLARIKSFDFFSNHFLPYIKLENLMALKEWIPKENLIIYDHRLFDINTNKWVRDVVYPKKIIPSAQESYEVYKEILSINEDSKSSFITISIEHKSPIVAKKWLDIIINNINKNMREIDSRKAENSISYLNEKFKSTNIQSSKDAISNLLEDQIQTLMLTAANENYVFKIIDAPIIKEMKSKPSRAFICILGSLLGAALSLIVVFLQNLKKSDKY
ncbi:MAG: chain length determinant protein [Rhodobiaceae bacterium]|nr:chain length determinant protein [Rhodobiaceae bacterium]|tara:strand:- start:22305 stop:23219 length:915 start_codon:yes stop_codon:yes gene_type:complete